jgi:hypothetical protein
VQSAVRRTVGGQVVKEEFSTIRCTVNAMCLQGQGYDTKRMGGVAIVKDDKQLCIYRVIQFWEVIVSVIVRKKFVWECI